jgi:putative membrane fusion protein
VQQPLPQALQPGAAEGKALAEVATEAAGILSYQVDGLESTLVSSTSKDWTPALIRSLMPQPYKLGEIAAKGDPVFKVVDNLNLGLLTVVPAGTLDGIPPDTRVLLRLPGRAGAPVAARVTRWEPVGGEMLILLTAPVFPEDFTQIRRVKATLVFGSFSGAVVPRSAIDVRDGLQGIWVIEGRKQIFRPVQVVGGNQEEVALETDLQSGARVLKQAPAWMH